MKSFPFIEIITLMLAMVFHMRIKSTLFREREKLETARLLNGGSGVGEKYQILSDNPNCKLTLSSDYVTVVQNR